MSNRTNRLALAISGVLLAANGPSISAESAKVVRGRIVDDSTQTVVAPQHNEEFNTSLEGLRGHSDVWTRDLKTMRASEATLPKSQVSKSETLSDADLGALFESGRDELLRGSRAQLDRIAGELAGKQHLRFLIVGHADTQRLSPRTRAIFKDNQGLSEARAFQVAQYLRSKLNLSAEDFTVRGEGDRVPVADNTTADGMAKNRRVEVQVWFDQTTTSESAKVVPTAASSCYTQDVASTNQPMRISVDGQPVENAVPSEADHQRCVDVATDKHHIQIQFDPLNTDAALNVWAWPSETPPGQPVEFHTYSNYVHWISKAEVRLFAPGQDPRERPLQVLPVKIGSSIAWTPDRSIPTDALFLLRVYDDKGRFDETALKPLTIVDRARRLGDEATAQREQLTGYGENSLRVRNIQVIGGSVTVSGSDVSSTDVVSALGVDVPVDAHGRFVTRQLLPAGTHTIEVETRSPEGDFTRYSRNLTIAGDTFFYVALGELTASKNHTTGPAELVTQDSDTYAHESEVTGRGAFYIKGKIKEDYLVTASADTRERPIEDLFSNFTSKDPRFLLERIDAERAYPVYGDDSTSEWDAPTNGRFYARIEHRDSRLMWGNFQSAWTGLELNQFSRSLYGAEMLLKTDAATSFGERKFTNDVFAAEPGTLDSREEFRGTGGSLYYLHRQDITRGSERLWIEIRDATSGIVLQRTQLIPGQDYEMSYLQGRILLRAPLSSVADSSSLVQLGSLSGNPAYLVTTYEYTPGLNEADSNVYGLRNSTWLNDYVRVGMSGYRQGESQDRQTLGGLDATLRYRPATYLDLEFARSDGAASQLTSIDGGFGFNQSTTAGTRADASRVQGVFDLAEIWHDARGRGSVYWQDREAGFSGAGALATGQRIEQKGAAFSAPVGERVSVDVKADDRDAQMQSIQAEEAALHYQINERWSASIGGRHDDRENAVANASALLSQNGARTDGVLRFDYKPVTRTDATNSTSSAANAALQNAATGFDVARSTVPSNAAAETATRPAPWSAYSYVQQTLERDGDRDRNDRVGLGLEKQINDRFRVGGEVSDGSGGVGGKVTGDYRVNDRSNVYLGHSTETERPDSNYRGRFGNTVVGSRVKLSDQVSVYDEARDARGAGPQSLTNAFGVDLAPNDRWTYGLKFEAGTVSDPLAGDLKRRAAGVGLAYKFDQVKFTSNLEYRHEDGTTGERDTWLGRNTAGYQLTPEWRLVGKLNFSYSDASQGNFYDGDFIDASVGGAFRPTGNDRWNTLIQYRYYYTLPSPGQVNLSDDLLDYAQRSFVVSVDTIYDVLPWLSFGTKFAQRTGELRDTRTGGEWYSSRATLEIFRTDMHFIREWDALVEGRRLTVAEAEDSRTGVLAAIYRHIGGHAKLGVGYNFTDFSDDLTDLSYRSAGPFINLMSTF